MTAQRHNAILELLETESSYVDDLKCLIDVFVEPLKGNEKYMSSEDHRTVFSQLQTIYGLNLQLCNDIREAVTSKSSIGKVFVDFSSYLKLYTQFVANQERGVQILDGLVSKKGPLSTYLEEKRLQDDRCRKLPLDSFLMAPIQRLCKYPLLLKEILKGTSMEDEPEEYESLRNAISKVTVTVRSVNDTTRRIESVRKILSLQRSVDGFAKLHLVDPSRRFLREGTVLKMQKKTSGKRRFFLFNDILLWAKLISRSGLYSLKGKIWLRDAQVSEVGVYEGTDTVYPYAFTLVDCSRDRRKPYSLAFKTQEEKSEWFGDILHCIAHSVGHTDLLPGEDVLDEDAEDVLEPRRHVIALTPTVHSPDSSPKHSPREEISPEDITISAPSRVESDESLGELVSVLSDIQASYELDLDLTPHPSAASSPAPSPRETMQPLHPRRRVRRSRSMGSLKESTAAVKQMMESSWKDRSVVPQKPLPVPPRSDSEQMALRVSGSMPRDRPFPRHRRTNDIQESPSTRTMQVPIGKSNSMIAEKHPILKGASSPTVHRTTPHESKVSNASHSKSPPLRDKKEPHVEARGVTSPRERPLPRTSTSPRGPQPTPPLSRKSPRGPGSPRGSTSPRGPGSPRGSTSPRRPQPTPPLSRKSPRGPGSPRGSTSPRRPQPTPPLSRKSPRGPSSPRGSTSPRGPSSRGSRSPRGPSSPRGTRRGGTTSRGTRASGAAPGSSNIRARGATSRGSRGMRGGRSLPSIAPPK